MAIKIIDVKITTGNSWRNLSESQDWSTVKNTNADWQQPLQTAVVGRPVKIEVEIMENTWEEVTETFLSWNDIKTKFTTWLGLKNR